MSNIVIIDFSHGVNTKGKQSPDGRIREGRWSREVGKRIGSDLALLGFKVFEIIPEDDDIPLQKRCDRVNKIVKEHPNDKIIFISLHINAAPGDGWDDKASGCSVYVCNDARRESVQLGRNYYEFVNKLNLQGNRSVPSEGVWRANFKVLVGTQCPAILTENLFMTNHKEVDFLLSEKGKETIVNLHVLTVCKYFGVPCSMIVG